MKVFKTLVLDQKLWLQRYYCSIIKNRIRKGPITLLATLKCLVGHEIRLSFYLLRALVSANFRKSCFYFFNQPFFQLLFCRLVSIRKQLTLRFFLSFVLLEERHAAVMVRFTFTVVWIMDPLIQIDFQHAVAHKSTVLPFKLLFLTFSAV